jgi:hypothetical protein
MPFEQAVEHENPDARMWCISRVIALLAILLLSFVMAARSVAMRETRKQNR